VNPSGNSLRAGRRRKEENGAFELLRRAPLRTYELLTSGHFPTGSVEFRRTAVLSSAHIVVCRSSSDSWEIRNKSKNCIINSYYFISTTHIYTICTTPDYSKALESVDTEVQHTTTLARPLVRVNRINKLQDDREVCICAVGLCDQKWGQYRERRDGNTTDARQCETHNTALGLHLHTLTAHKFANNP